MFSGAPTFEGREEISPWQSRVANSALTPRSLSTWKAK
jgi:hypothetical protein